MTGQPNRFPTELCWLLRVREKLFTSTSIASIISSFQIVSIFVVCCVRQHACHVVLANLRPPGTNPNRYARPPSRSEFAITYCPHYVYECLLYAMLALICGTLSGWLCFVFVAANQMHLLLRQRHWYASPKKGL
jgi:hypothetical protein